MEVTDPAQQIDELQVPKKPKRYIIWGIIAVLLIAAVAILPGWYNYFFGSCTPRELSAATEQFAPLMDRHADAVNVAGSTARIALAAPIAELQAVGREFAAVPVPACMEEYKALLVLSNQSAVNGFLLFMSDEPEMRINAEFYRATGSLDRATAELERLHRCAPNCGD